ncbi:MAG TPA: YfiR family protein [Rhodothermales bacterium]|nr:YfiR family protein [Rhodothermales bacterium]
MAPVEATAYERSARRGRGLAHWLVLATLLVASIETTAAQTTPSPEYQVKAVFLYHFTEFVTWPRSAFPEAQAPLVIGVLGDDPFGAYLDETVRGEMVNGHPLVVRRYDRVEQVEGCQILFVSPSEAGRLGRILSRTSDRPLLTVGDTDDFARDGGIIQFVTVRGKIRLRINVDAARSAGLTISSKLLGLADIVTTSRS